MIDGEEGSNRFVIGEHDGWIGCVVALLSDLRSSEENAISPSRNTVGLALGAGSVGILSTP